MEINFNDLELDLEHNALDSLNHGIDHLIANNSDTDLKYSILHFAQAVELFMKARLARDHHLLIFSKPENCTIDDKTITVDETFKRLNAINVRLSEEAVNTFKSLHKIRNQIQHYKCRVTKNEVESLVGQFYKNFEKFLEDELGIELKDKLDTNHYKLLQDTFYSFDEKLSRAYEKIEHLIPSEVDLGCYQNLVCPNCWNDTLYYPDPRSEIAERKIIQCFFCDSKYEVNECQKCGSFLFYKDKQCSECWIEEQESLNR